MMSHDVMTFQDAFDTPLITTPWMELTGQIFPRLTSTHPPREITHASYDHLVIVFSGVSPHRAYSPLPSSQCSSVQETSPHNFCGSHWAARCAPPAAVPPSSSTPPVLTFAGPRPSFLDQILTSSPTDNSLELGSSSVSVLCKLRRICSPRMHVAPIP